jgi:hypothetical protein
VARSDVRQDVSSFDVTKTHASKRAFLSPLSCLSDSTGICVGVSFSQGDDRKNRLQKASPFGAGGDEGGIDLVSLP